MRSNATPPSPLRLQNIMCADVSFARWQPYYTDREPHLARLTPAFGLLALAATPLLLGLAAESRRPGLVLPCAIYLLSLLGMLGSSTLFRHTPLRWAKYGWLLRRLDHSCDLSVHRWHLHTVHDRADARRAGRTDGGGVGRRADRRRLQARIPGRLRGARLVCAVWAAADTSVHGAAGSGADSRRPCALYGRRGDSSPTGAVSHANLACLCDCRRRLSLRARARLSRKTAQMSAPVADLERDGTIISDVVFDRGLHKNRASTDARCSTRDCSPYAKSV